MADSTVVTRSARNGFGVLIVLLLAISTYQFVTIGTFTWPVGLLWVAAVVTFYGSKRYYRRVEGDRAPSQSGDASSGTEND